MTYPRYFVAAPGYEHLFKTESNHTLYVVVKYQGGRGICIDGRGFEREPEFSEHETDMNVARGFWKEIYAYEAVLV